MWKIISYLERAVSAVPRESFLIVGGFVRLLAIRFCAVFLAIMVASSSGVLAESEADVHKRTSPAITKESVWNTERQVVQTAKQRCADFGGRQLEECFADAMEGLGASAEAASFTRSFGRGVFVRKFRQTGRMDVAYILYPFKANELAGILLVNGDPPIIDVDDITLLPKEVMEQDKTYGAIRKSYPRLTLWPGDRSSKYPLVDPLPDGGQAFVVPYTLRNFCHSCEVLGTVFLAFDSDKEGKLMGIRFLRVEQAPKKATTKIEARKESEQIRFIVMAEEGKEFTVRLASNRTTGYQWRPSEPLDEHVVKLVRSEYVPFDTNAIGGGGEEIWTFLATGKGDNEITMEYARPWEKVQTASKTATIKVSVRPRP
jgi:predicted secreted protein